MSEREPWYADGLRFACTQCGACCRGEGYVWVEDRTAKELAAFLDLDIQEFGRLYLRRVGERLALTDRQDGACVFWNDGCEVYPVRPRQCRTFPFWRDNLESEQVWNEAAEGSPGVNTGRLYTREEIERLAGGRGAAQIETEVGR